MGFTISLSGKMISFKVKEIFNYLHANDEVRKFGIHHFQAGFKGEFSVTKSECWGWLLFTSQLSMVSVVLLTCNYFITSRNIDLVDPFPL